MATSPHQMLLLLLVSFLSHLPLPTSSTMAGAPLRVELTHVDHDLNLPTRQLLQRAIERTNRRLSILMQPPMPMTSPWPVGAPLIGVGEFLVDLYIGTPPQPLQLMFDAGTDLLWTNCPPCYDCLPAVNPIYDSIKSWTFEPVPCARRLCQSLQPFRCGPFYPSCNYLYAYHGASFRTSGILAKETFGFLYNNSSAFFGFDGVAFGCSSMTVGPPADGVIGFGRGPLSLVSQMGTNNFSYCLTEFGEKKKKSPLVFGGGAPPGFGNGSRVQSTPLVRNPQQPSAYYVILEGITVGETLIPNPNATFGSNPFGSGQMAIGTNWVFSVLQEDVYVKVKRAFLSQMKGFAHVNGSDLSMSLDLCFKPALRSKAKVPKLVFHFKGADLELSPDKYMYTDTQLAGAGASCLMVQRSPDRSMLGNYQQGNVQMFFDIEHEKLSFMPARCAHI